MNNEFLNKHVKRLFDKSFEKTLLDQPVINKKVKFSLRGNKPKLKTTKLLPQPLKPTQYKPPKPTPKPRKTPQNQPQNHEYFQSDQFHYQDLDYCLNVDRSLYKDVDHCLDANHHQDPDQKPQNQ